MRLLVCGGRDYQDRERVFHVLDRVHAKTPILLLVHGACCKRGSPTELTGADRWAQEWAQEREIPYAGVPAQWSRRGKAGGPLRNMAMARDWAIEGAIAFPGGDGTDNMVDEARKAGIKVWDLRRPPAEVASD